MKLVRIDFVYKYLPVFMFSTDNLKSWKGGQANGPFCFIRPKYYEFDDRGIQEHEKTHAKQWYRSLGLHGFLYFFSKEYRLDMEIEAYATQLSYYTTNDIPEWVVSALMTQYGFTDITREEIIERFNHGF